MLESLYKYTLALSEEDKQQLLLNIYHQIDPKYKRTRKSIDVAATYVNNEHVDGGVAMRLIERNYNHNVLIYFGYFLGKIKIEYHCDDRRFFYKVKESLVLAEVRKFKLQQFGV